MEQGKTNLATLAVIIASSVSPVESQAEEAVSPRVMSYVRTVTDDHFTSNLDNVRVNPLAGGYGAAANVRLEIAGIAYVLRVINESESLLQRNREFYAMKEAAAVETAPAIRWISSDGIVSPPKTNFSYRICLKTEETGSKLRNFYAL